ncbi:MAG TPA: Rid family detoxifying hydrolase [Smithellaceae bacterium]|nr:Rid family detoxifying hydrolase [Smithellaceae bacterium]
MAKKVFVSEKFPAAGPYSTAAEANGFLFLSGQLPLNAASGEVIDDAAAAARQVLQNIRTILRENGLDMQDIVKTTIFLKNIVDFPLINEVYAEFFPTAPPARSTVEVSSLPRGVRVEIEAIAARR